MPDETIKNNKDGMDRDQTHYKLALTQTISDDAFNSDSLVQLAETIGDESAETPDNSGIHSILLETLEDGELDQKFIDFYADDEQESFKHLATTQDEPWADEFDTQTASDSDDELDSYIPGRYKINGFIGSDSNGKVFSAQDNNLERNIAVKFLKPELLEDYEQTQRFISEAKHSAAIDCPGALPVHDIDFTDGALPFYTMRKSIGLSLAELIERSHSFHHAFIHSFSQRVEIIIRICEIIRHAHRKGIIHGDIKPGHIIVQSFNDVQLKGWEHSAAADQQDRTTLGTPMYMSPEQARKERCDQLSDIYCLGSTLLHLITLRLPLYNDHPPTFWSMKQQGHYDDFTAEELKVIPPSLVAIIRRCLASDRLKRYQDVEDVRRDLRSFQRGLPVEAGKEKKRTRGAGAGLFIVLLALVSVLAATVYYTQSRQTPAAVTWTTLYQESFSQADQESLRKNWVSCYFNADNTQQRIPRTKEQPDSWVTENGYLRPQPFTSAQLRHNTIYRQAHLHDAFDLSLEVLGYRSRPQLQIIFNGRDRFSGYALAFDQEDHRHLVLTKLGASEPLASAVLDQAIVQNQTYHILIKRRNDHLSVLLDGTRVLHAIDLVPLNGPEHQFFGFESNHLATHIEQVKISAPPHQQGLNTLHIPDHYLNHGNPATALVWYDKLRSDHQTNHSIAPYALFRSGLCLLALEQPQEASVRFETFLNFHDHHPLAPAARQHIERVQANKAGNSQNREAADHD